MMSLNRRAALAAWTAMAIFGAGPALAADLHFPSSEDLRQLREAREIQLAPDGVHVLAVITDTTADGGRPHLWLLDRLAGEQHQLTYSSTPQDKGQTKGMWAPDGRSVLFIADPGSGARLYRLPMSGGEAEQFILARGKNDKPASGWSAAVDGVEATAEDFALSPDGETIALIASDGDDADTVARKDKKDDAEVFGHAEHKKRLYLVDAKAGSSQA
jgi:dipeptidyl aminopeptidase/acylaminoacyl peptidase